MAIAMMPLEIACRMPSIASGKNPCAIAQGGPPFSPSISR
jgi:hypothetical protein